MKGLEKVYKAHHKNRGEGFAILQNERGSFLRKHLGTGKKIMDVGCRDGQLTSTYAEGNQVTGVDIDSAALERAQQNVGIKTIHHDLNSDWDFTEESFDAVVACEFLEHIYFPDRIMKEVSEKLVKRGLFVGTVPHAYSLQSRVKFLLGIKRGTPLEDPTHINHFSYKMFRSILSESFEIVEIVGITPKRYRWLASVFPYLFAHDLLFAAKKKSATQE